MVQRTRSVEIRADIHYCMKNKSLRFYFNFSDEALGLVIVILGTTVMNQKAHNLFGE